MQKDRAESLSLLVLFVGVSLLLFFVFSSFIPLLSLSIVFAILLHRPYEQLTRMLGGGKNLAAALVVGLTLVLFIVPLFFLGGRIFQEAQSLYLSMYGNGAQSLHVIQQAIESPIQRVFPAFVFDINAFVVNTLGVISNNLGTLAYQTLYIFFETFLILLALFFFLRDGRGLLTTLSNASPLGKETTREVLDKMYQTIKSVIQGTLVTALIRWLSIWVAFYLFGVPNAILWSSIGGIVGAIPGLGTLFAFIPAVVFFYLQGNMLAALGLALFSVAIVVFVDNILTSYLFGKGLEVSPIFVLLSILAAIVFFGPLGFVLGPLVLSVFLSVVRVYTQTEREA